jgi:DNA-binding response OmpR family regulator
MNRKPGKVTMKRILIVDDDAEITDSLSMLLREKYEVGIASNGFSAIDKLKDTSYDLILLDLLMPGLDGAGFVQSMHDRGVTTPILLLSASKSAAEKARVLQVTDYLLKPFHIDELEAKIERLIGV